MAAMARPAYGPCSGAVSHEIRARLTWNCSQIRAAESAIRSTPTELALCSSGYPGAAGESVKVSKSIFDTAVSDCAAGSTEMHISGSNPFRSTTQRRDIARFSVSLDILDISEEHPPR